MRPAGILAALLAMVGAGAAAWLYFAPDPDERLAACRSGTGPLVGAALGGPFTLTDHTGRSVTADDIVDRLTLMYFGYTFCPDFCPIDAATMAEAKALLSERNIDIRAVFVTVDPRRDTPEVLAAFVDNLHPGMIGLTGSEAAIAEAARHWRVYFALPNDLDDPFYLVDHSTFMYLMHPEAGFLDFFRHGTTPDAIAESVACFADRLS